MCIWRISSLSQHLKLQVPCPLLKLVTDEEGISPGSPYIQMTPAEIPFYMQLLKIQEPCPPFQMVSLRQVTFVEPFPKYLLRYNISLLKQLKFSTEISKDLL